MPEELRTRFEQAAADVTGLSQRPDPGDLLRLYALYKQATSGDCTGERPAMMSFEKRAKFDSWKALEGTPPETAMQLYIDAVDELKTADAKK